MKQLLTFALSAALVLTMGACKGGKGTSNSKPREKIVETPKTNAEMSVERNSYYFKDLTPKSRPVKQTYVIVNTGTDPLVINQVEFHCDCLEATFTKHPIQPGEKGEVTLKLDVSKVGTGEVRRIVNVHSNAKNSPFPLELWAEVYEKD